LFEDLFHRPLTAVFDVPSASSDGGAILLKAADRRLSLLSRLSGALVDGRQQGKVHHGLVEMLSQRVYGLALGHEDANDAARLADDPMHKLLLGRDPLKGKSLASQPTLSRFENDITRGELKKMSEELFETVLDRHARRRRRVRRITVDLDVTDDPTHGAQQLTFFNGFYDSHCYLPMLAFLTFDCEREQFLCAAALRPGNAATHAGALTMLTRIIARLQGRFPQARILVRLDGGFATPELFEFFDVVGVDYVVAMAKNKVLERKVDLDMVIARVLSDATNQTEHVYTDFTYKAGTWDHERRVVCKAEVVRLEGREPKLNARFVVTNLPHTPQWVYEHIYCMRGDAENRIKELFDVSLGRTSCSRFLANQLRVLLAAAAFVLLQELRIAAHGTAWARAQVSTLRLELLKIGVQVIASARRLVLRLPASFPYRDGWRQIALRSGASPG
jgi:hypothetical protein